MVEQRVRVSNVIGTYVSILFNRLTFYTSFLVKPSHCRYSNKNRLDRWCEMFCIFCRPKVKVKVLKVHTLDIAPLRIANHHHRSTQVWHMFSRYFTVLPAHPHVHPQSEWAIPAFAFPAMAGTYLLTPEWWKAEYLGAK